MGQNRLFKRFHLNNGHDTVKPQFRLLKQRSITDKKSTPSAIDLFNGGIKNQTGSVA